MKTFKLILIGLLSGLVWVWISQWVCPDPYEIEILGTSKNGALGAGVVTGIVMVLSSASLYGMSVRHLLWFSPLSVYLSVGIYGVVIVLIRTWIIRDLPGDVRLSVTLYKTVVAMGWGITFVPQMAVVVHGLAYLHHRFLRLFISSKVGR